MSIVLRGWLGTGKTSNESFSVTIQHHKTMKTLRESRVLVGCSICRALANELEKREDLDVTQDTDIAIQAELTRLDDKDNLAFRKGSGDTSIFRLEFKLETKQLGPWMQMAKVETLLRTFALKPTSKSIPQLIFSTYTCFCSVFSVTSSVALISAPRVQGVHVEAARTQTLSRLPMCSFLCPCSDRQAALSVSLVIPSTMALP
jgi:hypothetical protein